MSGLCQDCKWWQSREIGMGACQKVIQGEEGLHLMEPNDFLISAQDRRGFLITGPDFGCVQFEPADG